MTQTNCFSPQRFRKVWSGLPPSIQTKIRTKASVEKMSVSAVIRDWWPAIWERIQEKP